MATLPNAKHELFAQEIAKGSSQREAYKVAGYAAKADDVVDAAASRLLSDVRVQARVAELQSRAATRTITTVETLIEAGWGILDAAKSAEDFSAASQTLERVAKIAGLWVDKSQGNNTVDIRSWLNDLN